MTARNVAQLATRVRTATQLVLSRDLQLGADSLGKVGTGLIRRKQCYSVKMMGEKKREIMTLLRVLYQHCNNAVNCSCNSNVLAFSSFDQKRRCKPCVAPHCFLCSRSSPFFFTHRSRQSKFVYIFGALLHDQFTALLQSC